MKITFYFFLFVILTCNSIFSQTCLPNGITFSTQQQIDNFATNYSGCTEILGDVTIEGNTVYAITSLDGLSQLTSIKGNLRISYNQSLTSLDGLHNLSSVGGFLHLFDNGLEEIFALSNVNTIGSSLSIFDNDALVSLTGLNGITTMLGVLIIAKNNVLSSIEGIGNIYFGITDLRIFQNPLLSTCNLPRICNYITSGGTNMITNNATGCTSVAEISSACLANDPCSKFYLNLNFDPIQDGLYQAIEEVYSTGNVPASGNVAFKAAQCITLDAGFSVQKNAVFLAETTPCGL